MRKVTLSACLISMLTMARFAHAGSGTEAASFLDIPVGGRPAAMGDAYSALATDAYAVTSNPAGLGFLKNTELAAQHLSYLESIHYEYLSFVRPVTAASSLGVSAQYLGSGDIDQTDTTGNTVGQFSSHFAAYSLSYGHSLGDKLSLGATAKIIDAKIADASAHAFAADFGSLYRMTEKLNLAAVVTNAGTKLTFLNDGGSLPLAFKLGAAYQPDTHFTLSVQGVAEQNGLINGQFGGEWRPLEMIAVRAGYRTDTLKGLDALAGFSTGLGLQLWGQELSYAWVPYGDLGNTQYFSMLLRFGDSPEAKRNLIQYQNIKRHRTAQSTSEIEQADPEYQQLLQLMPDTPKDAYTQGPATGGTAQ